MGGRASVRTPYRTVGLTRRFVPTVVPGARPAGTAVVGRRGCAATRQGRDLVGGQGDKRPGWVSSSGLAPRVVMNVGAGGLLRSCWCVGGRTGCRSRGSVSYTHLRAHETDSY